MTTARSNSSRTPFFLVLKSIGRYYNRPTLGLIWFFLRQVIELRVGVVINPVSGRDGHRRETGLGRATLARTLCDARRISAEIVLTTGPGHATAIVERFIR